ncbi:Hsp20/alpha crystallin family protein [Aspergillus lucknowensis]|uniref:HSP20-like chaperone n=1 Tax=Aspergillus lucknowensis TaxID=176173 RepID=A0ABR4LYW7_9EURO
MSKQLLSKLSALNTLKYHPIRLSPSHLQTRTMSLMQRRPGNTGGGGIFSLMRALDDLDSSLTNRTWGTDFAAAGAAYSPRFDFRETKDAYELDGELPGVEKKDLTLDFSDPATLNVKGHTESRSSTEDPEGSWWCMERSTGDFRRSFSFPGPVEQDGVSASLRNGVLSITVPKAKEVAAGKRIEVT